ncbi:MAG TPA: hypothetical protein VLI05_00735 [Candidatus Saccharimonadia bacterium]|nr:hypothetical protein [Candidatus Saccharimonadia bacterium]
MTTAPSEIAYPESHPDHRPTYKPQVKNGYFVASCSCGQWSMEVPLVAGAGNSGDGTLVEAERGIAAALHEQHLRTYWRQAVVGWDELVKAVSRHQYLSSVCADAMGGLLGRLDRHSPRSRQEFADGLVAHAEVRLCHYDHLMDCLRATGAEVPIGPSRHRVPVNACYPDTAWSVETLALEDRLVAQVADRPFPTVVADLLETLGHISELQHLLGVSDEAIQSWLDGSKKPRRQHEDRARLWLLIVSVVAEGGAADRARSWLSLPNAYLGDHTPWEVANTASSPLSFHRVLTAARTFAEHIRSQ